MGVDTIALLRIPALPPPRSAFGAEHLVVHRGDASLLHTFGRFEGTPADEHALALRHLLGQALEDHDDPRGVLFFPDVCEPLGQSYEAIVQEVGTAGVWAPKVDATHVPARYTEAPADTHEAIVSKMIRAMGRDPAKRLDTMAQVNLLVIESTGGRADAVAAYAAGVEELGTAMGAEFAKTYDASVRRKVATDQAAQAARLERGRNLWAKAQAGEPLISAETFAAFIKSGPVDAMSKNMDAGVRSALERALEQQLAKVDPEKLPEDDVGKALLEALRKSKKDP